MCTTTRRSQVKKIIFFHSLKAPAALINANLNMFLFFLLTGALENRAVIREPATLLITNATRSDTAKYRCEVTAADDQKSFDEIVIDLVVRGNLIHLNE